MRPGDVVADRFEIEAVAGSGGMGTVYRALDRQGRGCVALKILRGVEFDDELRADRDLRFEREARLLALLDHPGIVRYVAHGSTPAGIAFLAMEWLEGEDL